MKMCFELKSGLKVCFEGDGCVKDIPSSLNGDLGTFELAMFIEKYMSDIIKMQSKIPKRCKCTVLVDDCKYVGEYVSESSIDGNPIFKVKNISSIK